MLSARCSARHRVARRLPRGGDGIGGSLAPSRAISPSSKGARPPALAEALAIVGERVVAVSRSPPSHTRPDAGSRAASSQPMGTRRRGAKSAPSGAGSSSVMGAASSRGALGGRGPPRWGAAPARRARRRREQRAPAGRLNRRARPAPRAPCRAGDRRRAPGRERGRRREGRVEAGEELNQHRARAAARSRAPLGLR